MLEKVSKTKLRASPAVSCPRPLIHRTGSLADGWCRCGAVLRCRVKRSGSLTRREVKPMRVLTFASLLLCSLCFIAKGDAQSPEVAERPVWAMEFIEVQPGKTALALGYLDDHWMRSEEHTSELQSRLHLVCRLLLEKKKRITDKQSDQHSVSYQ